ncbi:MAG: hypothetical protein A2Y72_06950 [Chloroflexi bacterium RBG_13_53_26]|nr:MAG: hypothetical protein A2Y72_06950 [Chloroflexi bacterium RBG_13_53_26]
MQKTKRAFYLAVLLGIASVILSMSLPFIVRPAAAQREVGATELVYDDGIPYKPVIESEVACPSCIEYQGVRFGLGGVEIAAVTSLRFYAYATESRNLRVHINDVNQVPLLPDPIVVPVSRNGWYTVPIPEITVTGDFYVWIQTPSKTAMPFHDRQKDTDRSFRADEPDIAIFPVQYGDLLIRASVRAEIHVGKEKLPSGAFKYKYQVIQEAIDDADPLLTVIVHPGTYPENVLVNKDLAIISSDGPSVTFVEAANGSADVFNVTSDGVAIDGFTIRGGSGDQVAGVRLNDVSECLVSNNTISGNYYGVYISEPSEAGGSRQNVILQNSATSNTYGIWVGGQQNNICGNHMEGNTATKGSDIYLEEDSADNWLRFNSFSSGSGTNQATQVYYNGFFKPVDAIQNWWGDPSGPYHASGNPAGTGANVGEMVEFSPWLESAPLYVATGTPDVGDYVLDARAEASTSVTLRGSGDPIIWVASYSGNPGGESPEVSILKWIDVCISDTGSVEEIEIKADYTMDELGDLTEGDLRLYWWDGSEWMVCSKQKVYKAEDCIRATIGADSSPNLSNLAGTPFAIGGALNSSGFQWWWILMVLAGLIGLFVLVVIGRIVLRLISHRGAYYDYE